MIWFCMQIWDKVRIINQTRAVFSSTKKKKKKKKTGTTFASTRKKLSLTSVNPYIVIAFLKIRLNPFCYLSIGRFCLIQEIFNLHAMLRMSQVSSSTSAFLSISSDLGQLANCYLGCSTSIFWCISILIISEYWKVVTSHFPPYSCFAIETDCLWESVWCIFSIILLPMKITIFIKPIYVWNFLFTTTI